MGIGNGMKLLYKMDIYLEIKNETVFVLRYRHR